MIYIMCFEAYTTCRKTQNVLCYICILCFMIPFITQWRTNKSWNRENTSKNLTQSRQTVLFCKTLLFLSHDPFSVLNVKIAWSIINYPSDLIWKTDRFIYFLSVVTCCQFCVCHDYKTASFIFFVIQYRFHSSMNTCTNVPCCEEI